MRTQTHTEGRPRGDMGRRRPSVRRNPIRSHLDLQLLACRSVRKQISVVEALGLSCLVMLALVNEYHAHDGPGKSLNGM